MGLMISGEGGGTDWEPVAEGTYFGRCITVCDLGVQPTKFGSKEKVYLGFEIPSVRVKWKKDDKEHEGPALIGSTYTSSVHEKSILGQHLTSWRGKQFTEDERKAFDLFNVLGAPCMLSVVHNTRGTNTYANISAIMRVPQGTAMPDAEQEPVGYTATDPAYSGTIDKLPEWLKKLALEGQRQQTYPDNAVPPSGEGMQGASQPPMPPADDDFSDDIPF